MSKDTQPGPSTPKRWKYSTEEVASRIESGNWTDNDLEYCSEISFDEEEPVLTGEEGVAGASDVPSTSPVMGQPLAADLPMEYQEYWKYCFSPTNFWNILFRRQMPSRCFSKTKVTQGM